MESRNLFKRDGVNNRQAASRTKYLWPMGVREAKAWIAASPAIQNLLFANARAAGLIKYDKATGLWVGTARCRRVGGQA